MLPVYYEIKAFPGLEGTTDGHRFTQMIFEKRSDPFFEISASV